MSVIVVPARIQSKRLYGKPLIKIGGVPLIVKVVQRCLLSKADHVAVITDSRDIYEVCCKETEVNVILDDTDVQTGTDRVAIAAEKYSDNIIVNVQCDEPFLPEELINNVISDLENADTNYINSCYTIISEKDAMNPNNVKVVLDKDNFALYFSRALIPFHRENVENKCYYKHIGIYGFYRDVLMNFRSLEEGLLEKVEKLEQLRALENNIKIKMLEWHSDIVSINTYEDVVLAENSLKGN